VGSPEETGCKRGDPPTACKENNHPGVGQVLQLRQKLVKKSCPEGAQSPSLILGDLKIIKQFGLKQVILPLVKQKIGVRLVEG
jgi:hypothetical protein